MSTEVKTHKFQKGNPGGPGRPKGKVDYRAIFDQCVTAEAFYKIIDKAVEEAISGSSATRARAFVVSFVPAPILKTVKVESSDDSTTDSRKLLDALVKAMPVRSSKAIPVQSETDASSMPIATIKLCVISHTHCNTLAKENLGRFCINSVRSEPLRRQSDRQQRVRC